MQLLQRRPERSLVLQHVLQDAFALEDVEVRVGHRGRDRVTTEGVPVQERGITLVERLGDPVAHDAGTDGGVAARHALGAGDHVRLVAVPFGAEHVPEPTEGTDHLVAHQQHALAGNQVAVHLHERRPLVLVHRLRRQFRERDAAAPRDS